MKRYRARVAIRSINMKLPPGSFVEVASPAQFDWQAMYIGKTGSVVGETIRGIYEVQFGDDGAGSFRAESLRLV